MSLVTIRSGVHVGDRDDTAEFVTWFGATPVVRFSPITLELADHKSLIGIEGRLGDRQPVTLQFRGAGMAAGYDQLQALSCKRLLGGQPKTTLSGFRDAGTGKDEGELVQLEMRLYQDAAVRNEWGVLTQVRNTVRAGSWEVTGIFHPCDALFWIGTTNWFLSPPAYTALGGV